MRLKTTFTLGPSSAQNETIIHLLHSADRFRLNASHMDANQLRTWLARLKALFSQAGRTIPVAIDLQGAKMRIGKYLTKEQLPEEVTLSLGDSSSVDELIPVPHETFFKELREGDIISLNDARIILQVTSVTPLAAEAQVLQNGPLSSFKGINRRVHPIPYRELSLTDERMIDVSREYDFVQYAFSFTHNGEEAQLLRPVTGDRHLIAKIERPDAMEFLRRIDDNFNEIWLCRGDLGAQAGLSRLGAIQEEMSRTIQLLKHPCHLAGQVLEHMTHFPEPTRSEVVHLYDIEKRGFAGIVLSDETAIGKNPVAVARFLQQLREEQQEQL